MRWTTESPDIKLARDFATLNGRARKTEGYLLEEQGGQYRWCFIWEDPNTPNQHSDWFDTEAQAIRDAAEDWDTNGSVHEYPTYLSMLRREATKAERRAA